MDLAIVAVFCSVLFEPVELELLASLANTTAFAAVTAERLQWVLGADSAEMRERAVQQNGSQRMSDASNQSLLSQHGHTMDESLGRSHRPLVSLQTLAK